MPTLRKRKIYNKQANFQLEKEQTQPKVNRRKRIIKIRAEINEIEIRKKNTQRKAIKLWAVFLKDKQNWQTFRLKTQREKIQ